MLEILQNLKNCEMIWNMCVILSINVCMHVFVEEDRHGFENDTRVVGK